MPEMDGWTLARRLREAGYETTPIIVVSAHPEDPNLWYGERRLHDAYLAKPMDLDLLLATLGERLGLAWTEIAPSQAQTPDDSTPPPAHQLDELERLIDIGHVSALRVRLDELREADPVNGAGLIARMGAAVADFRLDKAADLLRAARRPRA